MKSLRKQFTEIYCDAANSEKTFNLLHDLYCEKHRAYHNLNHINFLLKLFRQFDEYIEDKECVFFTIWFHDAICDPQKNDNEQRSAELAAQCLQKISMPKDKITKIEKIILATEKHLCENLDSDGKLFLDFDLAILGSGDDIYDEYAKAIRREYSFVSDEDYKSGRARVLQNFQKREFIYLTDDLREKFEAKARANIKREILELSTNAK